MADADLGTLLEPHKSTLKDMGQSLSSGDHAKFAESAAGLVAVLATGNPQVALLAPFARKAVAKAFGNAADGMFKRELAAMEAEEDRQKFVGQIGEAVEALIGQALIQLVRVQHNVKDEVLDALGGMRAELAGFREQFAAGLGGETVRVDRQDVEGGIGVRVRATTSKRVWIGHQTVRGAGSVGIDLE
jgi:hypothetical protein